MMGSTKLSCLFLVLLGIIIHVNGSGGGGGGGGGGGLPGLPGGSADDLSDNYYGVSPNYGHGSSYGSYSRKQLLRYLLSLLQESDLDTTDYRYPSRHRYRYKGAGSGGNGGSGGLGGGSGEPGEPGNR